MKSLTIWTNGAVSNPLDTICAENGPKQCSHAHMLEKLFPGLNWNITNISFFSSYHQLVSFNQFLFPPCFLNVISCSVTSGCISGFQLWRARHASGVTSNFLFSHLEFVWDCHRNFWKCFISLMEILNLKDGIFRKKIVKIVAIAFFSPKIV